MDENTVKKQETKRETKKNPLTIGIGTQETADRFLALNRQRGETYGDTLSYLLDAYENPPKDADSAATIAKLQRRIEELEQDNLGYRSEEDNYRIKISDLEAQLKAAISDANANAESGLGQQLQLEELRKLTEGAVILKPNPVVAHFLIQMAERTKSTPERILEQLFLADLQNPLANNLPYTVTSREIRRVMEELKGKEA